MRKYNIIRRLIVAGVGILSLAAHVSGKESHTLPQKYDGSMNTYNLSINEPLSKAVPDSLTPIFVNYIGRHGARYLSSENKVGKLRNILVEAHSKGYITDEGRDFLELLDSVSAHTHGSWGALDEIGMEEECELARQMRALFPNLLKDGSIRAEATYVPRVIMSMYEFCHQLEELNQNLETYTSAGKQNNAQLRYFAMNEAYVDYLKGGAWEEAYAHFVEKKVPVAPAVILISDMYGMNTAKIREVSMDMYGILQSLRAAGLPAPTTRWMSEDEYRACWEAANLKHFLQRTPNDISSIPGKAAAPLLESFIAYGDSAASGKIGDLRAMLRFAHAETLMPIFGLMHLQDCWSATKDYAQLYKEWRDYEVVPLGANLIVVSLRGDSGKVYAATRLNGKWIAPIGDGRMYVGWDELKEYWLSQLYILKDGH